MFKIVRYATGKSTVKPDGILAINKTLTSYSGYKPIGIVGQKTNHGGSLAPTFLHVDIDTAFMEVAWCNFSTSTFTDCVGEVWVLYGRS